MTQQDTAGSRTRENDAAFSRVLANTAWLLGGKGIGGILSLFYLAIVTRSLGVADFGRFALVLSTAQAISVLVTFESWQIIVRFGQRHLISGDAHALNRLIRFCVLIDIGSAAVGCLIAAAVTLLLGPFFGWSPELRSQALLFCAAMLIGIRSTPTGLLRLFDRFDTGSVAETMVPVGRMIGAAVVLATGPSITAFLIVWAAAEIFCAAAYWVLALRAGRGRIGSWGAGRFLAARTENPGLLRFLTATNLSTTLNAVGKQVAVLVIGLFVGPAGAGLYRLANQLSQSLTKISGLLSRTIFAELARASASESAGQMQALFGRMNRLALITGASIVALILIVGKPILVLVAGEAFAGAYPLLVLLGIAASIDLVGVSFSPLLMATDRAGTSLRITFVTTLMLLGLLTLLLPRFGTVGAAYSSLATSVVGFLLMGWASRRALRRA
ncbi:MAG: oligosaccharide flippase family protein [Sphingobium sp.]|uniref:lipopolysaccharide biosynthesis protein n=1 Tax=Sphingobium sp. TaxID=1912891 RepID=UPI0029AB474D|nr:oligosaccharide flippase family protein [Sphingobium sp.]MDX3908653.1 oligosaccharide flippase family protein [Sphingobium sp.]